MKLCQQFSVRQHFLLSHYQIQPSIDNRPRQPLLFADASSDCQRTTDHISAQFTGWNTAIYCGGHPAWGQCEVIHMAPNPAFPERCAAALQDNGWLASDEALWFMRQLRDWRSDIAIGPIIQWSPSRDLQHLIASTCNALTIA